METKRKCIYCKRHLPNKCIKNYHAKCKNESKIEIEKPFKFCIEVVRDKEFTTIEL